MKKFTFLASSLILFGMGASAQKLASTTAENKKVVLEEFTGIHCGYCPDGHKRANDLRKANEGKVFLINIHSGGYATPQAGELDLRTTAGDGIDDASGLSGYPAGSVNRANTPWAMSRGAWAGAAATILGQQAPVNVGIEASVDRKTRELTVNVEAYYTDNSSASTNKLTVVLTQDGILGTQTTYGNFNPEGWLDGKYIHNHVFRMSLTPGSFGEEIKTTTKGTLVEKTYTITLPEDIKGVPLDIFKLHAVAFVAESNSNILNGAEANVTFDQTNLTDLALKNATVFPTDLCVTALNPKAEVTNNGTKDVSSFELSVDINGDVTKKKFDGTLKAGETTTVDFGSIPFTATGNLSFKLSGFTDIDGGVVTDFDGINNNATVTGIGFSPKAFEKIRARFEPGVVDKHVAFTPSGHTNYVKVTSTTTNIGAVSRGAVRFALHSSWNLAGKAGDIVLGEADFTNVTDPQVTYAYAYSDGSQNGTAPTIRVAVSEDCGKTWKTVEDVTPIETGQPVNTQNYYVPNGDTEYIPIAVSLKDYAGKTVLVKVSGIAGTGGNSLYIDGIEIGSEATMLSTEDVQPVAHNLYPNPASDFITIDLVSSAPATVKISDLNGKVVMEVSVSGMAQLDVSKLNAGVYTLTLNQNGNSSTEKVVLTK